MKPHNLFFLPVVVLILTGSGICQEENEGKKPDILAGTIEGLSVDNLLTSQLELVEGVEVVVSHIVMPPDTELPKHWHHGEEFAYLIDGARTTDSPATVLVFRVHESGQPVRVLVK
jgi:hypothetical protein